MSIYRLAGGYCTYYNSKKRSLECAENNLVDVSGETDRVGINKSTLWYQQKNLREGKRINIYRKVVKVSLMLISMILPSVSYGVNIIVYPNLATALMS